MIRQVVKSNHFGGTGHEQVTIFAAVCSVSGLLAYIISIWPGFFFSVALALSPTALNYTRPRGRAQKIVCPDLMPVYRSSVTCCSVAKAAASRLGSPPLINDARHPTALFAKNASKSDIAIPPL